jgi:acetyl esterase/lipase
MGFSAGGHLALMTGIRDGVAAYEAVDAVDGLSCRPDFVVPAYPGYILTRPGSGELADYVRIPPGMGPVFLVHASDDDEPGAQPEQSLALYGALRGAGVPVEMHIYEEGGHGFGVRQTGRPVSGWTDRLADWMRRRGILGHAVNGEE